MLKKKKPSELENLVKQNKKQEKIKKEKVDKKWIATVLITAFLLSFSLSFLSEMTIPNFSIWIGIIITLLFVCLGIIFDIIGVAVTATDEKVFQSMNSRRVKGANVAVKFKKNADKVSSFCCDVIGDVCSIISGASASAISLSLVKSFSLNPLIVSIIVASIMASLTIGGKALGKSFAINKSDIILYEFAKLISNFYK